MIIKYRSNLWAGLAGMAFGICLWILIPLYIGREMGVRSGITSRSMPTAIAVVSFLSGLGLVFQSLVLKRDTLKTLVLGQEAKALLFMAALAAYSVLFKYGFILSTAGLGVTTLAFCKCRRPLFYAIVVATVVALYFVFTRLLYVRLP